MKSLLSAEKLLQSARESLFLKRQREIRPEKLLWSLVQCFSTNQANEIAGLHRSFIRLTGSEVAYSSWYDQLSKPEFAEYVRKVYQKLLRELYVQKMDGLPAIFNEFKDVLIHDGSSWAVNKLLRDVFPGRFTKISPAAIELHATCSLKHESYEAIQIAPDSCSEHNFIPDPKEIDVTDKLLLYDRGYVNLPKMNRIGKAGGYYIVRAKKNCNPVICSVNDGSCRIRLWHDDVKLQYLHLVKKKNYDFQVRMKSGGRNYYLRLVALWNPNTKEHVLFLTNLSPDSITLKDVGRLYRLRWQVELGFKELKSHTGLKKFLTANENIVEGFIWVALIAMQIRRFIVLSAEQTGCGNRLSLHKGAISACDYMFELTRCALDNFHGIRRVLKEIFDFLKATMKFSNPQRKNALQKCVLEINPL